MKNRYTKINFKKSKEFTRRGAERILNTRAPQNL
ncbi:MAG: palindromic element RPE5 domain-containing protein [Rickettsia endosymbiont of Glossina mortisans submortisans]|nr:palindromic element RPE5 domain-containing protein [Rickettsia endosymbiont of Glossina mortisans submortisans]